MKNKILGVLLILGLAAAAHAQKDAKASEILNAVSEKYQKIPSFKASVRQEVISTNGNKVIDSFEAKITVKGNKYRLEIGEQEIYNNEKTVWTYLKEQNEVNINNYSPDSEDAVNSPAKIYDLYKKGFKYVYLGEQKADGQTYDMVDLAPEFPDKVNYFRILLHIKKDKSISSWEVFEKGNRKKFKFTILNFSPNTQVNDQFFDFDVKAHKGIEVIDLR